MNDEGQTEPEKGVDPAPGEAAGLPGEASAISRRVGDILDAAELEAQRLRDDARAEAAAHLDQARRLADDLVAERRRRIADVSDELLRKSEAVAARLDDAAPVRQGFENLVRALGSAAERLARDARSGPTDFAPQPPPPPPEPQRPAGPPAPPDPGPR